MGTSRILCIIHSSDPHGRAVARALNEWRDGDTLILAGICDAREEELLSRQMSDRNFVGLRLREQVANFHVEQEEGRVRALVEAANRRCSDLGRRVDTRFCAGGFLELMHELASELEPRLICLPRLEQGLLSRLWRGNRTETVVQSLRYPTVVV